MSLFRILRTPALLLAAGLSALNIGCSSRPSPADVLREANEGNTAAQYRYGIWALTGTKLKANPEAAVLWLRLAAADLHPEANTVLGICHLIGKGTPKDEKRGLSYLKTGARLGNAPACLTLAYFAQIKGKEGDMVQWIRRAAELGDLPSETYIAASILKGEDLGLSPAERIDYLRYAAMDGMPEASYALFLCNLQGIGLPRNADLATGWLELAAEQGYRPAKLLIRRLNRGDLEL